MSISDLRQIITDTVKDSEIVSGIEIMSRFDWKWHAIPTFNQFRQAIKNVDNLRIAKDEQGILQFSIQTDLDNCISEITKNDVMVIYEAYSKKIKKN